MKFILERVRAGVIGRLVAAAIVLAALELLGVAVFFPYLSILVVESPATDPGYVGRAYSWSGASSREGFLIAVSAALGAFFLLRFALIWLANRVRYRSNALVTTSLADELFRRLLGADYSYLANNSVSEMTGVINSQTIHATLCLDAWVSIATDSLFLFLILVTIGLVDVRLAAALVAGLGALSGLLYFTVIRRAAHFGKLQTDIHIRQYRFLYSVVSGLKDIKILGLERASEAEHRDLSVRYAGAVASYYVYQAMPRAVFELLVMGGLVGASVFLVLGEHDLNAAAPVIGLLAMALWRVIPSYNRVVTAYANYNYYKPSLAVVRKLYEALEERQVAVRRLELPFERMLEIRDVRFAHEGKPVLSGVNLTLRKGQSVGIVGLSGSGKTTFLDILAGLRRAEAGTFALDGTRFDPFETDALRRLSGYVPQNVTLIDDTIAFNIAFDRHPDAQRLRRAAQVARIEAFVDSLPQGFETSVGEGGVRVSGGQKQRIGIARALYRDPQLLIFDEATSSLDNITERELNAEIAALSGDKTLLIVAHRLSTVERCDAIHVFDEGRVVASGTHEELIRTSPAYRALYQAQEPVPAGAAA